MKVVHAVCTDAFAGVERHIAMLAVAQADAGHEVVVVGGHAATMRRIMERPQIRHIAAATVPAVRGVLDTLADADVFNVHMTAAEIAAALAWRSRRVPVVATRHFAAHRGQSSLAARWVARRAAGRISAQIAVSRYVAERVEPPSTVVVSGVPPVQGATPARLRSRTVLVAQRLEAEKRTADALRIVAASRIVEDGWRLDIAGTGSEAGRLRDLAAHLGLGDSVRFLGQRGDIDALMDDASILIAPRPDEALGLTVLEAMSHGLPVIAAAGGGHLETLGAAAPELCYPLDDGDLAAATMTLRGLAADAVRRDEVGARLRAVQRRDFTIDAQSLATEEVYRSVL